MSTRFLILFGVGILVVAGALFAILSANKGSHLVLKEKILKSWRSKLDKSADAVLETMEAKWKAMLSKGEAKEDLKERLMQIMKEEKNR